MNKPATRVNILCASLLVAGATQAQADDAAELAKKTQNPIASLMSVPFQYNYDHKMGPEGEGEKASLYIQPVLPFSLNNEWNLITRTILPVVDQQDIMPDGSLDESGVGDLVVSFFFSPREPTASGWIWGAGPVLLAPTASDELLGNEKWGAGPTAVALKQQNGFTMGALVNHIRSFTGDDDRDDVDISLLQPFFSYTTHTYTTVGINTESTYDWEAEEWSVPIHLTVSQMLKLGGQILSVSAGARYWADSPQYGPDDMGYRIAMTLLFPK